MRYALCLLALALLAPLAGCDSASGDASVLGGTYTAAFETRSLQITISDNGGDVTGTGFWDDEPDEVLDVNGNYNHPLVELVFDNEVLLPRFFDGTVSDDGATMLGTYSDGFGFETQVVFVR